ncbi:MAG TPA: ABC transporter permease [Phycisphaerales bacterium]|nr:ABC transporter permease [Phycisphaerales bacterium]HMP37579.1 ABC transporter permease [Phycisphaerales bacterium]
MLNPLFYIQAIALALGQIWANKTRSLLTMLGIIIGVASVTAVIAALVGLRTRVLSEFEGFGASKIFIFPSRPEGSARNVYPFERIRLRPEELTAISEQAASVRSITPVATLGLDVRSDRAQLDGVTITGIWPDWHDVERRAVILGRPFNAIDEENARQVCLVNDRAILELQLEADPVGRYLLIGGRRFLIVGVVETLTLTIVPSTNTAEIFIPFSVAVKLLPRDFFMSFSARIGSPELADEAKAEITALMRRMRGLEPDEPDTFRVAAIDQFISQFKALAAGITAIAGGIVGISLLVGGIGIMNIMLVSVSERTREIGLRKAVGATPAAILIQFLLEAITLCAVGGLIGVAIGQAFAFGLTKIPGAQLDQAEVPLWAIAMAFAFSGLVGIVFGMFPAIKASQLDPIEALRHE